MAPTTSHCLTFFIASDSVSRQQQRQPPNPGHNRDYDLPTAPALTLPSIPNPILAGTQMTPGLCFIMTAVCDAEVIAVATSATTRRLS
ncbi:hypothetical protein FRC08_001558 [Ceratobasidium sp. 394]|nr:hypothetical protein FRC08_001558 [Ceratobasidium sp. 394]